MERDIAASIERSDSAEALSVSTARQRRSNFRTERDVGAMLVEMPDDQLILWQEIEGVWPNTGAITAAFKVFGFIYYAPKGSYTNGVSDESLQIDAFLCR